MQTAMNVAPPCYDRCRAGHLSHLIPSGSMCDACFTYEQMVRLRMMNLGVGPRRVVATRVREEEVGNAGTELARSVMMRQLRDETDRLEARRITEDEERNRIIEEKRKQIADAVQTNQIRESLCLQFSHDCRICCMKNPLKRVAYTCGHIVCEPCAQTQELENGKVCLVCRKRCSYFRLYEHDGEEDAVSANVEIRKAAAEVQEAMEAMRSAMVTLEEKNKKLLALVHGE